MDIEKLIQSKEYKVAGAILDSGAFTVESIKNTLSERSIDISDDELKYIISYYHDVGLICKQGKYYIVS